MEGARSHPERAADALLSRSAGTALGIGLAVLAAAPLLVIDGTEARGYAAVIYAVVLSGYPSFTIAHGRIRPIRRELLFAAVNLPLLLAALWLSPLWAAGGLVLHGLWDWWHAQATTAKAGEPSWWPGFCLWFDWVFAIALLGFYWPGQL